MKFNWENASRVINIKEGEFYVFKKMDNEVDFLFEFLFKLKLNKVNSRNLIYYMRLKKEICCYIFNIFYFLFYNKSADLRDLKMELTRFPKLSYDKKLFYANQNFVTLKWQKGISFDFFKESENPISIDSSFFIRFYFNKYGQGIIRNFNFYKYIVYLTLIGFRCILLPKIKNEKSIRTRSNKT